MMSSDEYVQAAMKTSATENSDYPERMLHAAIGVCTEAGELLDAIKKHRFYGKPLDEANIKEEVGDIFWYIAEICEVHGWSFEEIMELNIEKLAARYPDSFSPDRAISRNLEKERKILEDGTKHPSSD